MVKSCVVYGCTNRWMTGSGIQFHIFPHSRPELLKKWVHAVRREYWAPSKYSVICSNHFTKASYVFRPGVDVQLLKDDAVPSVFSFPVNLKRKISHKRQLVRKAPAFYETFKDPLAVSGFSDSIKEDPELELGVDLIVNNILEDPSYFPECTINIKKEPEVKVEEDPFDADVGTFAEEFVAEWCPLSIKKEEDMASTEYATDTA